MFAKAVDRCIVAQDDRPGSRAVRITADVRFEMEDENGTFEIAVRPAMDFEAPCDMEFPLKALVIKDSGRAA